MIEKICPLHNVPFIKNKIVTCLCEINRVVDDEFMAKVFELYGKSRINIEVGCFPIIREFNQPKKNAFPRDNLSSENADSNIILK